MENADQPNQLARSFAFFFYAFCVFVGIRVWIEVVASGDKSAIIAASVITFLVVCCIYSRYRRHRRLMELRNRRRVVGGVDMFELFARHRGLLEAEGINVHGGLTQAAIDRLPNVVFKNGRLQMLPPAEGSDEQLVNKLEEGTLMTGSSSSSSPEGRQYKSISTTFSGDEAIEKEIARTIITNHHDISSCPICLNDFVLDEVLLFLPKCGHAYHRACISEWLVNHNSCPLCKHEVVAMPVLPENDPLIVNAEANNNHVVNVRNRPIVVMDDGGIAILRFPNQQGVGIYFMDPDVNNGRSLANNNAAVSSAPNNNYSPDVNVNITVSSSSSG